MFDGLQILSNTTKHNQTHTNTIKQHQTRCPNGKIFDHQQCLMVGLVAKHLSFVQALSMFDHQTMFDGVWSPNISRLSRALQILFFHCRKLRPVFFICQWPMTSLTVRGGK